MAAVENATRDEGDTTNHNSGAESDDEGGGKFSKKEFIGFVKNFPILYDATKELYRDKAKKENAWQAIAEASSMSASECKSKWKNIRDSYVKYINVQRTGNALTPGRKRKRAYKYSAILEFMRPFIFCRGEITSNENQSRPLTISPAKEELNNISVNMRAETTSQLNEEFNSRKDEHNDIGHLRQTTTINTTPPPRQSARKKRKLNTSREVSSPPTEVVTQCDSQSEDEDRLFCLSLVPTLRRFDLQTKQAAKIKLQTLLYEMEFEINGS